MKSRKARASLAMLAVLGFSQSCNEPDMYGSPITPDPADTTSQYRLMYGPPYSSYTQAEPAGPDAVPEDINTAEMQ